MQQTPDKIKHVARAIAALRSCSLEHKQQPVCPSCENARGYKDDVGCVMLARAAIQAMREPTEAMKQACYESWRMRPGASTPEQLWEAMMDAALE